MEEKILQQLTKIAKLLNEAIQLYKEQQQADIRNRLSKVTLFNCTFTATSEKTANIPLSIFPLTEYL